jgi:hypothetical protein
MLRAQRNKYFFFFSTMALPTADSTASVENDPAGTITRTPTVRDSLLQTPPLLWSPSQNSTNTVNHFSRPSPSGGAFEDLANNEVQQLLAMMFEALRTSGLSLPR